MLSQSHFLGLHMATVDVQEQVCRACQTPLKSIFDLGSLALSAFPLEMSDLSKAPLDLCRCPTCSLVQLRHTVSPDAMFKHYWYQSGINEAMRIELSDVVADAIEHLGSLRDGDVVVDVGANDGTLLSMYKERGVVRVAYEPADNFQAALLRHCDTVCQGYFPGECTLEQGSVSLLTSIACFYAVNDPIRFISAVDRVLSLSGLWIVQFQDLAQMLGATAFDNICHEHLFYPSLTSIERLLAPFDLTIIDAEYRLINGGSLRLTIGRRWRRVSPNVAFIRAKELGCDDDDTLVAFAKRVCRMRKQLHGVLDSLNNRVIDLYGASTKGNTLLQFCGLGPKMIRQAWERSPEKWGRKTITGIPIVSEADGRKNPPDVLLVGIWQFRDAIVRREQTYLEAGGTLLFPLPSVGLVRGRNVYKDLGARADAPTA